MSVRGPLVAIVGTTGVSKSRLAVDLALHLKANHEHSDSSHGFRGAQVINADAMQVYKGLDLITNKMSLEEQQGIPHHLMGFRQPGEQYLVTDWIKDATSCINKIYARNELPIVVGGTAYWLQNLLLSSRLASLESDPDPSVESKSPSEVLETRVSALSSEHRALWESLPEIAPKASEKPDDCFTLHGLLNALDPDTATRWHWRDARRVLTSLKVIKNQGAELVEYLPSKKVSQGDSSPMLLDEVISLFEDTRPLSYGCIPNLTYYTLVSTPE